MAKKDTESGAATEIKVLPVEVEAIVSNEISVVLTSQNISQEVMDDLKERYSGLTIKDANDKGGYKLVQESRKNLKAIRIGVEKAFKHLREIDQLKVKKKIEEENKWVAQLSELEDPLYEIEKKYEADRDAKKALDAQKAEQQGIERATQMMALGATLAAGNWVLGDLSYESVLVRGCDTEIYEDIKGKFKAKFDINEAARVKKEAEDKAAAAKLLKDQEDLLKAQAEAKKMRTEGRISFLQSLGMERNSLKTLYACGNEYVRMSDINEKDGEEWDTLLSGVKTAIEVAKTVEAEKKRKEELFQTRLARLQGWAYNGFTVNRPIGIEGKMDVVGSLEWVVEIPDKDFEHLVVENDKSVADLEDKKEIKRLKDLEDARLQGIGKSRREMLKTVNGRSLFSDLELGSLIAEDWDSSFLAIKKDYDKTQKELADQKEKDRVELLGEKERWEELIASYKAIVIPEFKSGQYRAKANSIRSLTDGLK